MAAKKRKPTPRPRSTAHIPCAVHVQRGGVSVSVDHIMLTQAVDVACYLLAQLEARRREHPELSRPQSVEHFGGYTVVPIEDDGTEARRTVGF